MVDPSREARVARACHRFLFLCVAVSCLASLVPRGHGLRQADAALALDAEIRARAGDNAAEIERALQEVLAEQRAAMEFLVRGMPTRDLQSLTAAYLLENVRLAHEARARPTGRSRTSSSSTMCCPTPWPVNRATPGGPTS